MGLACTTCDQSRAIDPGVLRSANPRTAKVSLSDPDAEPSWFWLDGSLDDSPGFKEFCKAMYVVAIEMLLAQHPHILSTRGDYENDPLFQVLLRKELESMWEVFPDKNIYERKAVEANNSNAGQTQQRLGEPSVIGDPERRQWTVREVETWIRTVYSGSNVNEVVQNIRNHQINGSIFAMLSEHKLEQLGINPFHTSTIRQAFVNGVDEFTQTPSRQKLQQHLSASMPPAFSMSVKDQGMYGDYASYNNPRYNPMVNNQNLFSPVSNPYEKISPLSYHSFGGMQLPHSQENIHMPPYMYQEKSPVFDDEEEAALTMPLPTYGDVQVFGVMPPDRSNPQASPEAYRMEESVYFNLGDPKGKLTETELIFLFNKHAEGGSIGKVQLMDLLKCWISKIDVSEKSRYLFERTLHDRALLLKNYLDDKKTGHITMKEFRRLSDYAIWEEIGFHNTTIDSERAKNMMWFKVFKDIQNLMHTNPNDLQLSEDNVLALWNRYEQSDRLTLKELMDFYVDWVRALKYFFGEIAEDFFERVYHDYRSKAIIARDFLDLNHDGVVKWTEFGPIASPAFWNLLDDRPDETNLDHPRDDNRPITTGWMIMTSEPTPDAF